jgi:hydroxymethylpyrimidine/phosphomethylpyrimidine kinase
MKPTKTSSTPIVLSIAGSDSGGGAGIQADIKAISATGGYACTAITAITSQNTLGVNAVFPIPVEHIEQQLEAVFSDLNVCAVKVGMLANTDIIKVVARTLKKYKPQHIVVDPVMVATSGDLLLKDDAISTLISELLPISDIITPNLPEAAALVGLPAPKNETEIEPIVLALKTLGAKYVLLKGGHFIDSPSSNDLLIGPDLAVELNAPRTLTSNTHGTGCTLSSALASYLAQGYSIEESAKLAKSYISNAISRADELVIGQGHGPVNHFYALLG